MEFEFAKYTEITDYALNRNGEYYSGNGYTRFFICPDVWDFHLIRVLPGFNMEYEKDDSKILVEMNNFSMDYKGQRLTIKKLNEILDEDDLSNYDCYEFSDMEDVIDSISDGFEILNLKS